jgi:hypothetical protein
VVSLGSTVIIVGLVAYMAVSGKDVMVRHAAPGPADRAAAEPGPGVRGRPVQAGRHRRPE